MDLQTGIAGGDKRASGSFVFLFLRVLTWGSLNGAGRSIVQHGRGLGPLRYQLGATPGNGPSCEFSVNACDG